MNFINDPFDIVTEIISENYPFTECDIYIGQSMTDGKETFGCTLFPEDKSQKPLVEIHYSLSMPDAVEVLVHELAHVIAGEEAEHNEVWEMAFSILHEKFQAKVEERFKKLGLY